MQISVIVPVWNEAENVKPLIERLHNALHPRGIDYEVVVIDDRSTDSTVPALHTLALTYPIRVIAKQGKQGKAQSIIEGTAAATHDIICMIDADLQYPPEAIYELLQPIVRDEADIVIGERSEKETTWLRRFISNAFCFIFARLMHGFCEDVQSGLKVFRKEILRRIDLKPTPWTFDLELLLRARNAGYRITSVPITFSERTQGESKIQLVRSSFEIGLHAVKMKLTELGRVPFLPEVTEKEGDGFHYKGKRFVPHTNLALHDTAFERVTRWQGVVCIVLLYVIIFGALINWHNTAIIIIAILTAVYFADLLFNLFLIYRSFSKSPEIVVSDEEIASVTDWPAYTIFCPLYKEREVLPQFISAMSSLDYPKEKMQVMLLLEEDDRQTIAEVSKMTLPSYFDTVVVPHSFPKTKPKALNYGLQHAIGEYVVVYDAEDVPDPQQLKKAILAFQKVDSRTKCIQAKLNFYNPHQNVLTRAFTAEYSLWFDLVLTGLQSLHAPIPLGGTSNHFRTDEIRNLKGWDPFNVTEDCDLGMRLVKNGYRTAIIDSVTLEEANSNLKNWFWQRSRWIKGYIQTYLVHMRKPQAFLTHWREPHVLTFQLIVGGKIFSMFINPLMWLITISYFVFRPIVGPFIESFYPAPVLYMAVTSLILGNFLYMYYYMIGCAKRGYDSIIKYVFLVPLYWLAMSVAAWTAVYLLLRKPHHWSKTKHGLHLKNEKGMAQSSQAIGRSLVTEAAQQAYPSIKSANI